jgi:hypothetical protein
VAIKLLRDDGNQRSVARFVQEAQILARLQQPNIVIVFDAGVDAGDRFIVMELVEGHTLRDLLDAEGPLPPERAAEIASHVASALGFAHVLAAAVYPRVGKAEFGRARWFKEIAQFGEDEEGLATAVEVDQAEGGRRDLHQARVLAQIVDTKYRLTKVGMWFFGVGFAFAGPAALLSVAWK